jgi:GDP-L-fucose synthase
MEKTAKIYVAGHNGLVGSAIVRRLKAQGFGNVVGRSHAELDLTRQEQVEAFFAEEKPEYVFLAAAKVGGIHANGAYPAQFAYSNFQIQCNVVHSAWLSKARKLCFLGSSCIYPKYALQPMREDFLLTGELEPTNRAYAIAKIGGIVMCQSYHQQYGANFVSVMPTNLYGPGDNYHPQDSHVLPALIRRFHEAKESKAESVTIWGTGNPRREFLYSDDLADACIFLMNNYNDPEIVNIGSGIEVTIKELAAAVKLAVGYQGAVRFDPTKPDGTPRKLLDCSRIHALGWNHSMELGEGIRLAYADFLKRWNAGEIQKVA